MSDFKLLEKILEKQEKLSEKQETMNIVLAENTLILKEHERRSIANEEAVQMLREEIKPLQKHKDAFNTAMKLMGILSVIVGVIAGLIKIAQAVIK